VNCYIHRLLYLYVLCCSTKFIGGHEDLCAGVLTTRTSQQWKRILHMRALLGGILVRNRVYISSTLNSTDQNIYKLFLTLSDCDLQ